jgi:Protein of unknown function (DUF3025)
MDQYAEWNLPSMMRSPMLEPLHPALARLAAVARGRGLDPGDFPSLELCNALLAENTPPIRVASGAALRFVPQANGGLPFEAQYEPRCYLKGELQTREYNWHDLLNALIWLTFPRAKAAVNARHYRSLVSGRHCQHAVSGNQAGSSQRGGGRDMLTLLDESGVIVPCADEELASLLRGFHWKKLFWGERARLADGMAFCILGHGLLEKTLRPYIGMTGQGLILSVDRGYFQWPLERRLAHLDEALARYLETPGLGENTRELTPVPLLGVPGWSAESGAENFYDNARYFRPGRLLSDDKSV